MNRSRFAQGRDVRVSTLEKLELIRLVEGFSLSVRRTLAEIGLPRSTFYAWYKRFLEGGRSNGSTQHHLFYFKDRRCCK